MVALVVILVVHALDIAAIEREGDSPVAADGHGPRALPLALQLVQVQAGQAHVAGYRGHAQATQNQSQPIGVLGLDSGLAPGGEESLHAFMPTGLDRHKTIVTRNGSRYNPHNALHPTGAGGVASAGGWARIVWRRKRNTLQLGRTSEAQMKRVTGIGGIFFNANDPVALRAWYKQHLGIDVQEWGGTAFTWTDAAGNPTKGTTVWSIGAADGEHFAPSKSTFMVNYRVEDLAAVLQALRDEGCNALEKTDDSDYGKFGWVMDPEGNKVELWQPPPGQWVPCRTGLAFGEPVM
jgi:predicted enzyme related to lactoylglutathione lyase